MLVQQHKLRAHSPCPALQARAGSFQTHTHEQPVLHGGPREGGEPGGRDQSSAEMRQRTGPPSIRAEGVQHNAGLGPVSLPSARPSMARSCGRASITSGDISITDPPGRLVSSQGPP